jgi:predicted aspartyl protease
MHFALIICLWFFAGFSCFAPAAVSDKSAPSDEIPFHLAGANNPLILVPVYVEEKGPYEFILDTGAYRCLLSPELSASVGILPESQQKATGIGGAIKISSAHATSLVVGSIRQQNVEVGITGDVPGLGNSVQNKVGGVLGFTFLKNLRLSVDYQRRLIRLFDSSVTSPGQKDTPASSSISFHLAAPSRSLIILPVFINGQGPFQFILDTGASSTVLSFNVARRLGLVAIGDRSGTGGGGKVSMLSSTVDSISIGQYSLRDFTVSVGEFLQTLSTVTGTKIDGIIGNTFLSNFVVTIDYPRGTLDLTPVVVR